MPAYLSLLTGESVEDLAAEMGTSARLRTLGHAVAFVLGFSAIFIALGLSASAIGGVLDANRSLIAQIGGVLVVILGLQMMGMLRIPWLMMDARFHLRQDRATFWTSGLVGMAFAAGWSPCIGPILAGILAIASQQHSTQAALLLAFYCLGLAVPFLAAAGAVGAMLPLLRRIRPALPAIEFAGRRISHRRRIGASQRCVPQRRRMVLSICPATDSLA